MTEGRGWADDWGSEIECSTNGITKKGESTKGKPKEELTEIILAAGGGNVKMAN